MRRKRIISIVAFVPALLLACLSLPVDTVGAPGESAMFHSRAALDSSNGWIDLTVWTDKQFANREIEVWNDNKKLAVAKLAKGDVPGFTEIAGATDVAAATIKLPFPPANKPYNLVLKMDYKVVGTATTTEKTRRYKKDASRDPESAWYAPIGTRPNVFFSRYFSMQSKFDTPQLPKLVIADPAREKDNATPVKSLKEFLGDYTVEVKYFNASGAQVEKAEIPGQYRASVNVTANGKTYGMQYDLVRQATVTDFGKMSQAANEARKESTDTSAAPPVSASAGMVNSQASIDFHHGYIHVKLWQQPSKTFVGKTIEICRGTTVEGRATFAAGGSDTAVANIRIPLKPVGEKYDLYIRFQGLNIGPVDWSKAINVLTPDPKIHVSPEMWYGGGVGVSSNYMTREAWQHGPFFDRFLTFEKYLFREDVFPKIQFVSPGRLPDSRDHLVKNVEDYVGTCELETRFFDADYKPVEKPEQPGRYTAVTTVKSSKGGTFTWYAMLCKVPPASFFKGSPPSEIRDDLLGFSAMNAQRVAAAMDRQEGKTDASIPDIVDAQWIKFMFKQGKPIDLPYRYAIHPPPGFNDSKLWPAIIYLHGGGVGGWDHFAAKGLLGFLFRGNQYRNRFVVICPNSDGGNWSGKKVIKLLDICQTIYPIDPNRTVMAGHSRGSAAAIGIANGWPRRFTALVPCAHAAGINPQVAQNLRANNVAVWQFCGEYDTAALTRADAMFSMLVDAGANARYNRLPGWGHGTEHYAFGQPDLYDWLSTLDRRKPCIPGDAPRGGAGLGGKSGGLGGRSGGLGGSSGGLGGNSGGLGGSSGGLGGMSGGLGGNPGGLGGSSGGLGGNSGGLGGSSKGLGGGADAGKAAKQQADGPTVPNIPFNNAEDYIRQMREKWDPQGWAAELFKGNVHPQVNLPIGPWPYYETPQGKAYWGKVLKEREEAIKGPEAKAGGGNAAKAGGGIKK